jgi:hypothetical protein
MPHPIRRSDPLWLAAEGARIDRSAVLAERLEQTLAVAQHQAVQLAGATTGLAQRKADAVEHMCALALQEIAGEAALIREGISQAMEDVA